MLKYRNRKSGVIITEYRSKYTIVRIGLLGSISLDIHPMWVIDENAIIDLSFV